MAVVKSKRGESELNVVTNSRKLAVYTIKICTNEKNFPKRYRWCVTNEIVKWISFTNRCGRVIKMVRKISEQEQIRKERQKALAERVKQKELDELMLEQMVEIDFRQSMTEMGVK